VQISEVSHISCNISIKKEKPKKEKIIQTRMTIITTNVESLLCDRHHAKPLLNLILRIPRGVTTVTSYDRWGNCTK